MITLTNDQTWAGVMAGVAAAAVLQSFLVGVVFVLAAIMLLRTPSVPALPLRPLHPVDFTAILIGYLLALALYIACVSFTVDVEM